LKLKKATGPAPLIKKPPQGSGSGGRPYNPTGGDIQQSPYPQAGSGSVPKK